MNLRSSNLGGRDFVLRMLKTRKFWIGRMRSTGVVVHDVTLFVMWRRVEPETRSWWFVCSQSIS